MLKDIPYVDIDLKALYIKGQALHAEVENINISLMGNIIKVEEPEVITEDEEKVQEPVNKVEDYYTLGRDKLQEKLPDGAKKISDYIFVVPDIVALICRMLKDSRVPIKTKLAVSASLAYVIFPTDLIPDKIPFIGKIDEIAVVFFALNRIATDVPTKVILENWAGKDELVLVLKNGLEYVTNFTGAKNVEKLYNVVEELSTL